MKRLIIEIIQFILIVLMIGITNLQNPWLLALVAVSLWGIAIIGYMKGQWSQEKLCDKYHTFRFYEEMYKVHMKGHDDK